MREDLRRMDVTDWRIRAHRRDDWKMVVKEANVLQGLQNHGIVVVVVVVVVVYLQGSTIDCNHEPDRSHQHIRT